MNPDSLLSDTPGDASKLAITYARVSTDKQDNSLEAQLAKMSDHIKGCHLMIGESFHDEGVSGSVPFRKRPGGAACWRRLQEGQIKTLVVAKLDRLGRSAVDLFETARDLDLMGVDFHLIDLGANSKSPAGKFLFGMMAVYAEFERALIQERVNTGLAQKRTRGEFCGGHAPFGWNATLTGRVTDKGTAVRALSPNPAEQDTIRQMEQWYTIDRYTFHRIAVELNSRGVRTKSGKGKWQCGNVANVLTSAYTRQLINDDLKQKAA